MLIILNNDRLKIYGRVSNDITIDQLKALPVGIYESGPTTNVYPWCRIIILSSNHILCIGNNVTQNGGVYYLTNSNTWRSL